jgi:endonuclease YncB( thermonuclease family)
VIEAVRADRRALLRAGLLAAGLFSAPLRAAFGRPRPKPASFEASLSSIDDGDSFSARRKDGTRVRIRLAGIDAPERTQPWAGIARKHLASLLEGSALRITPVKTDPWGRYVALVDADGQDPALAMLEAGLAWHFARYDRDLPNERRERYAAAAARARSQRDGLWQQPSPEAPWDFRRRTRAAQEAAEAPARSLWRMVS